MSYSQHVNAGTRYIDIRDPEHDLTGQHYRVFEGGDVFVWIHRSQKASGWQKIKSTRRIKRVRKLAGVIEKNSGRSNLA